MPGEGPEIYVPGQWRCAKCGFVLYQRTLNAIDGSVTARDDPGDKCPNDGAPLWRVTWKDRCLESEERLAQLLADPRVVAIEVELIGRAG